MAGTSAYPGATDAWATSRVDATGAATTHAQEHNDVNDSINKIEGELGTDPSGTFSTVKLRLDARLTCRVTADQTFTTQTPANVTNMAFPVAASQDYYFKFIIGCTMGTARGIEVAVTCPGSPTFFVYTAHIFGQVTTAGSTDASVTGIATTSGGAISHTPTAGATTSMVIVEGILANGANAGTLQLQASHGNGTTSVNVVVKKGSYGELYLN